MKVAVALVSLFVAGLAHAHEVGLSRGEYEIRGTTVEAALSFSRKELLALEPALDSNADGDLDDGELGTRSSSAAEAIVAGLLVEGEGRCEGRLRRARLTEEDGVILEALYRCPSIGDAVRFEARFVRLLGAGHRHLVMGSGAVAYRGSEVFKLAALGGDEDEIGYFELLKLGVIHILVGWDHLLFLFGLILVGGRLRHMVAVITAFTIGHSVTLGLASLGIWAPSPSIIEPLIALSIVYVGIENFFVESVAKRWYLTGVFGLVHGFGFAGVLAEIGLPAAGVLPALLSFNLGVELGQIAVLLLVVPVLVRLREKPWFLRPGIPVLNGLVILLGAFWFVERVW